MVKDYMKRHGGNTEEEKWKAFEYLISTPQVPSNLLK